VLEHLYDPLGTIDKCGKLLAPSGSMIITTPVYGSSVHGFTGERWLHWHVPYQGQLVLQKTMEALLAIKSGFDIAWSLFVTPADWFIAQMRF